MHFKHESSANFPPNSALLVELSPPLKSFVLLRCLKRSSRMALQWSQLRVQWGRRTSNRGLTALLGDVEAEESLPPPPPPSTGNDRDIPVGPVEVPVAVAVVVFAALWLLSLIGGGASSFCGRFWRTVERGVVGWSTPPPPLRNRCSCAKSRPPRRPQRVFCMVQKNLRSPVGLKKGLIALHPLHGTS